jgi:hypothetical protein
MKNVTYPLELPKDLFERVQAVAERSKKELSATFRDLIIDGIATQPASADIAQVSDTWEKLGPAPDVLYDKL